jgi:hypothetical protein
LGAGPLGVLTASSECLLNLDWRHSIACDELPVRAESGRPSRVFALSAAMRCDAYAGASGEKEDLPVEAVAV